MPTLVHEPGSTTANTFADLVWYKSFLSTRLPVPTWLAAALAGTIDQQLEVDLIASRRVLESLVAWTGSASTSTQKLTWPREGMYDVNNYLIGSGVIPDGLKDAQCELGVLLRTNPNLFADSSAKRKGVKRVKASTVEVEFQATSISDIEMLEASLALERPEYLFYKLPSSVLALLVPSWYVRSSVVPEDEAFIFEVV